MLTFIWSCMMISLFATIGAIMWGLIIAALAALISLVSYIIVNITDRRLSHEE